MKTNRPWFGDMVEDLKRELVPGSRGYMRERTWEQVAQIMTERTGMTWTVSMVRKEPDRRPPGKRENKNENNRRKDPPTHQISSLLARWTRPQTGV